MHVERFEKAFLILSAVMLVSFLAALFYAAWGMGKTLPGATAEIVPAEVQQTPPFDRPGLRQVSENHYEAVVIAQAWAYTPAEIRVPAGARVDFVVTSLDVVHGFHIEHTLVNMMVLPGQVSRTSQTFEEPGTYMLLCHEYCGFGHHAMFGRVVVE
ncbi:MAG: cytochrome c oxidase subunit II [Gemmatimonadota bacterium]|jgi:cytochrome c oxidase subunit 2